MNFDKLVILSLFSTKDSTFKMAVNQGAEFGYSN